MSDYNLTGTIKLLNDVQTFDSGFKKREFVVTTQGEYPQDIKLEAFKDNADKLANFKVGDTVVVNFDIRGNEYNGKYYNNLIAWKIAMTSGTNFEGIKQENPNQLNGEMAEDFNENQQSIVNDESDELPF
jgi:hypothetical protein